MNTDSRIYVFTDSSVNTKTRVGIGCYLILKNLHDEIHVENIRSIRLTDTSSTMAELSTIKYVLNKLDAYGITENINLYTDCGNYLNLIENRQYNINLIEHRNYHMYKEIIDLTNKLNINIIWVEGHSKRKNTSSLHETAFCIVDRTARSRLRMQHRAYSQKH